MPRPIRDAGTPGEPNKVTAAREEEARRLAAARAAATADALLGRAPSAKGKVQPPSRPVPPPSAALETPVANLKRRAIVENDLTPRAAQMLYDTPTRVFTGDMKPAPGVNGAYYSRRFTPNWTGGRIDTTYNPETLTHEALHKWYATETPYPLQRAWKANWEQNMPPAEREALRNAAEDRWFYDNPDEGFAWGGDKGPEYLPAGARENYYTGFFRDRDYRNPYEDAEQARFMLHDMMVNTMPPHLADFGTYSVPIADAGLRPYWSEYPNAWNRMAEELRRWRNPSAAG